MISKRDKKGTKKQMYREITKGDVGKAVFTAFGKQWMASSFIGRILKQDVGKRVYLIGDILQVENDQQFKERISKQGKN